MEKKNVVIVINDLGLGGAENLLIDILPDISAVYNVVLVMLSRINDFDEKETAYCYKRYSLGFTGKLSMLRCIYRLRKIIKDCHPVLVHSHLFYSNMIARIACPSNVPCLSTLHSVLSYDVFNKSKMWTFLEKHTLKNYHSVMAVSQYVLTDYQRAIKKTNQSFVLANCIQDYFFDTQQPQKSFNKRVPLKMVAVGNTKYLKNYGYLIEAFRHLKMYNVSLDIYGTDKGNMQPGLKKIIADNQLPVLFKGCEHDVHKLLLNYDLYVMSSKSEGFGIAVTEAMATGLPLLLSDLPVLRDVTFNNALFFDITDPKFFVERIKEIFEGKYDLNAMAEKGISIAKENYTRSAYIEKLFAIYTKLTS